MEEARRRYVFSLATSAARREPRSSDDADGDEVDEDLALGSLAEELAAAAVEDWVPGCDGLPEPDFDGSAEEELAAAEGVVVDSDLGAGVEVEAPAAKRLRVS